jgi:hypothetical protein
VDEAIRAFGIGLAVAPSLIAFVHLWLAQDLGYSLFLFWTLLLFCPWLGPALYFFWLLWPLATPLVLVVVGGFLTIARSGTLFDVALARSWTAVPLDSYSAGLVSEGLFDPTFMNPRYTYSFDGKTFHGDRLSFLPRPWDARDYEFSAGPTHVFVNAARPEQSVLRRDIPARELKHSLIALVALITGAALAWLASGPDGRPRAARISRIDCSGLVFVRYGAAREVRRPWARRAALSPRA